MLVKYTKDVQHIAKTMLNWLKGKPKLNWKNLESIEQLNELFDDSLQNGTRFGLFKHSTRCSISTMAKSRLDAVEDESAIPCYYLDLLAHRDVSNAIAELTQVEHASPQLFVIEQGKVVSVSSHNSISPGEIAKQ